MNNHYIYELKKDQLNYDNLIQKNSSNINLKDQEYLSELLMNPNKKEENFQNNNQMNENMSTESLIKTAIIMILKLIKLIKLKIFRLIIKL